MTHTRYLVRVSFDLEVDVPTDVDPVFALEDNCCPGTGAVYSAWHKLKEKYDQDGFCWACASNGDVRIIRRVSGEPHDPFHGTRWARGPIGKPSP